MGPPIVFVLTLNWDFHAALRLNYTRLRGLLVLPAERLMFPFCKFVRESLSKFIFTENEVCVFVAVGGCVCLGGEETGDQAANRGEEEDPCRGLPHQDQEWGQPPHGKYSDQ